MIYFNSLKLNDGSKRKNGGTDWCSIDSMGEREMGRKRKCFFLRKCSFSEKLLASQGHVGASKPVAQLRRHKNIRRTVHRQYDGTGILVN